MNTIMVRKKPLVVEAMRLSRENIDVVQGWILHHGGRCAASAGGVGLHLMTMEGTMLVPFDHWIIRGIEGEFYGVHPKVFDASYEVV